MARKKRPAVIVWFRRDLRLEDNPALLAATESGRPVIPMYIWPAGHDSAYALQGTAAAWNLLNAGELDDALRQRNSRLVIRHGDPADELPRLAEQFEADIVFANALREPEADAADRALQAALGTQGVKLEILPGNLLHEPGTLTTASGSPYKVFTPFHRQFLQHYRHAPPLHAPGRLAEPDTWPDSAELKELLAALRPEYLSSADKWKPGAFAAGERLRNFTDSDLASYDARRDMLSPAATSGISPYLQCGAISARQVWDAAEVSAGNYGGETGESVHAFQRQLVWREFCYHILALFPRLATEPYRQEFAAFPWQPDGGLVERWQSGETGYPVVDAAMRQLAAEGWMPGRARMVVASFLAKHLMQDWRYGEQWFRERLVDADLACNAFNWQWVAGCGFDAAPYFRIFNPITQGTKFDPAGEYVRRHVPELDALPDKQIHAPWAAPEKMLRSAGVELGRSYPRPVVDHGQARERALAAYRGLKGR